MAFTVTSSGRRLAMSVLLALALAGLVIRAFAPNPSTLHDIGTLLLVLWLPAVGNLIAYLIRKIPHRPPARPAHDFAAASPFAPQLRAEVETEGMPPQVAALVAAGDRRCMVVKEQQAFTARLERPLLDMLGGAGREVFALELLHPATALPHLPTGAAFHLVVGNTAVAKGRVLG